MLSSCFKALALLKLDSGETIFNYGDMGVLFYVILKGEVHIKILTDISHKFTEKQCLEYIVKHYKDINFTETEGVEDHIMEQAEEMISKGLIIYSSRKVILTYFNV